ncbi:hypothetical protein CRD75_01000 [Streptococcus pyogenes]|uniref:Uncharacterized protein n=1 Tax=Streptococcus pyogenes serotype M1 TaxID=301447 RepID=Q9A1N3_STRP1|nr:hypothetical protein SPy_0180 [Streptococcus pyogenes M1 GAS]AAX71266.1 hypothetical protein M28_Spy0152 [Streptococcus pyogenes MGAS6180]APX41027.1 hypothetical protein A4265_08520 [Streptococcus pyogenes]ATL56204.1 hypothetical protein CRD75_01000 [Streptococcus pyogenes]AUG49740.1 hypothetical protein CCX85_00980 [Streptococcus pyogenes]
MLIIVWASPFDLSFSMNCLNANEHKLDEPYVVEFLETRYKVLVLDQLR